MKKNIIFILLYICVCLCFSLDAQVGIKTIQPVGVFHIDPKGDTSGTTNTLDDVVVMPGGKVGVGTIMPTANLDIRGNLRIVDGTEADKMLLTSDANGVGAWKRKTLGQRVQGNISALTPSKRVNGGSTFSQMGVYITLPPGRWQVTFVATFANTYTNGLNIWWDLSASGTVDTISGRVLSCFAPANSYIPVTAIYFVTHTVATTYYLWAVSMNLPVGQSIPYSSEGNFWAIQVR